MPVCMVNVGLKSIPSQAIAKPVVWMLNCYESSLATSTPTRLMYKQSCNRSGGPLFRRGSFDLNYLSSSVGALFEDTVSWNHFKFTQSKAKHGILLNCSLCLMPRDIVLYLVCRLQICVKMHILRLFKNYFSFTTREKAMNCPRIWAVCLRADFASLCNSGSTNSTCPAPRFAKKQLGVSCQYI